MIPKKLSQLPPFASKPLLYAAQKRGIAIAINNGDAAHIIGLAEILWEACPEIRKFAATPEEIAAMIGKPKPTEPVKRWWQW